jgi:hypothetical protein
MYSLTPPAAKQQLGRQGRLFGWGVVSCWCYTSPVYEDAASYLFAARFIKMHTAMGSTHESTTRVLLPLPAAHCTALVPCRHRLQRVHRCSTFCGPGPVTLPSQHLPLLPSAGLHTAAKRLAHTCLGQGGCGQGPVHPLIQSSNTCIKATALVTEHHTFTAPDSEWQV